MVVMWGQAVSLAIVMVSFSVSSAAPFQEYGVVNPVDPFLFVGDSLSLICNITHGGIGENSSSLFFEIKNSKGSKLAEASQTQVLDAKAISLNIPRVKGDDEATYTCYQRTDPLGEETPRIIGHQVVRIDYKPQEIKNETCRVYNWEEMTCTWDLGVTYYHPSLVNVSVHWLSPGNHYNYLKCSSLTSTSCHWDTSIYQHLHLYIVQVNVTYIVSGEVLTQTSKIFYVKTQLYETSAIEIADVHVKSIQALVEPAPVQNLTALAENQTCVVLTWEYPWAVNKPKMFDVKMKSADTTGVDETTTLEAAGGNQRHEFSQQSRICNLQPHTFYHFRVAVQPFRTNSSRWLKRGHTSKWRETTVWTKQGVPSAAPEICPVCFQELTDSNSISKKRKVAIIWKDIPKFFLHGQLIFYNVTYRGLKSQSQGNTIIKNSLDKTASMTTVELVLPSKEEGFRIGISGATEAGVSAETSFIEVPALTKESHTFQDFYVEHDRLEEKSQKLHLSWSYFKEKNVEDIGGISATHTLSAVFIVWCRKNGTRIQCLDKVQWIKLPPDNLTFELDVDKLGVHLDHLLVGIAAQITDGLGLHSGGINWSQCLFIRNQKPKMKPKNVRAYPSKSAKGLTIVWEQYGCKDETSHIIGYEVLYCPLLGGENCQDEHRMLKVSNHVTEVTLPNLTKDMRYQVNVAALSSDGHGPASVSNFHFEGTDVSGFAYSTWLPVTLAILVVFVLLICVFIIRRSYRKQRQKIVQVLQLLEPIPPKEGDCAYSETCKRRRGSLPEPPLNALNSSQPCHAKQSATSSSDEKSANSNTPLIIADQYHMVTEPQNTDEKSPFICENKQHSDGAQPQQSHDLKYKSSLTGRAESYQIMGGDIQSSDGSRTQGVNTAPKVSVDDRNSVGNQGSFSQNIMIVNATNGKGINHLGENISLHGDAQKTLTKNASLGQNLQQQSGNTLNNQKCSSTGDENITDFKPVSNLSDQVLSSAANGTQNDFDLAYSDMNMIVQGQLGSQSPRNNPPTTVSTSQCSSLANTSASDTLNSYTTIGISGLTPLATDLSFSQRVPSDGSPRNPSIILPDSECASDAGHCPSHSKEPHNLTPFIYPASAIPGGSSDILNDANQTSHPNFDISFPESIQYTKIAPCQTWSSDYVPHA